jgi:hypothetical protein
MNVDINIIDHKDQRYETTGDWYWEGDNLTINISDMGSWKSELLVALHELVEVMLCKSNDIAEEDVTKFDVEHLDLEDPGSDKRAPYHKEHMLALSVEYLVCTQLGEDWDEHNERSEDLYTPPQKEI